MPMTAETKAKRVGAMENKLRLLRKTLADVQGRIAALNVEIEFAERLLEHVKTTPVLDGNRSAPITFNGS